MIKSILHVHGQKRPLHKTKIVISSLYLLEVKSAILIPRRCSVRAFTKPVGVLSQKQTTVCTVTFTNWYHSGDKYLKPRPLNRVFVPLRFFFKFSNRYPCLFYIDSRHLPQSFCTHNLHTGRFPGHCTPEHQLHCPWRKKKHKSVSMEQSWRGDFQCRFLTSKIEENPRLDMYLSSQYGVIYTVGKKAFIHWGHVKTINFSRAKWAKTKVSVHLH